MESTRVHDYLDRIANLLRAEARRTGAHQGLMPVHLEVLRYIDVANHYSNTPAAVAEYLEQTKGTVSQTLQLLERRGLIAKALDDRDRRVIHMELTEPGRAVLASAFPPGVLCKALAELGEDQCTDLEVILQRLLTQLQRANHMKTFGVCKTCLHNQPQSGEYARCGLTGEPLAVPDQEKICREHAPRGPSIGAP